MQQNRFLSKLAGGDEEQELAAYRRGVDSEISGLEFRKKSNEWDKLSDAFNTHGDLSKVESEVADNVLIAWPSVLKGIQLVQQNGNHLHALDYGCGGGGFCQLLSTKGYSVMGCDTSSAMIQVAKKNLPHLKFNECDSENIHQFSNLLFDLITSMMVIPFINRIDQLFSHLNHVLKPGGMLALAVFHPEYVTKNHGKGKCFCDFETPDQPRTGFLRFKTNIKIPVFIRTLEEYDQQIIPLGYKRIFHDTPPFTEEYLATYPTEDDVSSPEFLILVYQK